MKPKRKMLPVFLAALAVVVMVAEPSFAAATGMPWETRLNTILNSVTGPVAQVIGALLVIITGIGVAMSEGGSTARKVLFCICGLSVTFSAVSYMLPWLGYTAGASL